MPCLCKKCQNRRVECGEEYCDQCILDSLEDEASKNIYSGGRFYGDKFKKKANEGET